MPEYVLRWSEREGPGGRVVRYEKSFRYRTARDHWAELIAMKPTFVGFDAWLDPPAEADDPCDKPIR